MDIAEALPMRSDAIFRLASATKLLSTVVLLRLVEHGLIRSLDDPVSSYLPYFVPAVIPDPELPRSAWRVEPARRPVSVRDLLRHTAGLQYAFGLNALDTEYRALGFPDWKGSLAQFATAMATLPLAFQPGTRICYGYGYDILGCVMEVVCSARLDEVMRQHLTEPLGLADTGFFVPPAKRQRLANHYAWCDGHLTPDDDRPDRSFLTLPDGLSAGGGWSTGYGGMLSTASDFGCVLRMLLRGGCDEGGSRLLSQASVDEMFREQTSDVATGIGHRSPPALDQPGRGFGLGGAVDKKDSSDALHWGGAPYNTSFLVDRARGCYGILFAQTGPFEGEFAPGGLKHGFRQWVRDAAAARP